MMSKKIKTGLTIFLLSISITLNYAVEEDSESETSPTRILKYMHAIWPNGNCAENLIENPKFTQITLACNDNYTAHLREKFLNIFSKNGVKLRKETYRIDPNSASYFYKYILSDHIFYVKLFFRNPAIVWPLHENQRPKLAIFVNNVKDMETLGKWSRTKFPLSFAVSLPNEHIEEIMEHAFKEGNDPWILYNGNFNPLKTPGDDLDKLTTELKKIPEEKYPFSGLTVGLSSTDLKDTQSLRMLLKNMKKEGLRKFLAPATLEVIDTSRILGVTSITSVFNLSDSAKKPDFIWDEAYHAAQKTGYAVIMLNAGDDKSMEFLIKMISDNLNYVDYVNLKHLPITENPVH